MEDLKNEHVQKDARICQPWCRQGGRQGVMEERQLHKKLHEGCRGRDVGGGSVQGSRAGTKESDQTFSATQTSPPIIRILNLYERKFKSDL